MIKGYEGTLYGRFRQNKFSDIYPDSATFITDYSSIGIPQSITQDKAETLYYLLYANYGNSVISSSDTNRFKYKLFSIIWQSGPTWVKRLDIQDKLRNLTESEIRSGSFQIYNTSDNPSIAPGTDAEETLEFIKQQNTSRNKKGTVEAYAALDSMLRTDVTQEFLNRFKSLFLTIVEPEDTLLYENIGDY